MALRLRIVSDHRRALGKRSSVVFGVSGGNIGRSADNDWVLPDPSRYVSGRHARIKFAGGRYFIEDTSTNGTYLNDADQPMPKSRPQALHNGDIIRLGEYQIVVALDGDGGSTLNNGAMVNLDSAPGESDAESLQVQDSLDALSNSALFGKPADAGPAVPASQAFGRSALLDGSDVRPATDAAIADIAAPEDSDIVAARRLERLARAVRDRESPAAGPDARAGLEAFCRGAGIDPEKLPEGNATAMLQIAGRLLHEALISLKSLDAKQGEFRRQFRLPPARDEETQPFKLASTTDELLTELFTSHDSRRRDAGQWLRACFAQQAGHQDALAQAVRAGFLEYLAQLAPAELERRFAGAPKRAAAGAAKANIWDLYADFYRIASEVSPDTGVPSLYAEALANAYSAAQKKQPG